MQLLTFAFQEQPPYLSVQACPSYQRIKHVQTRNLKYLISTSRQSRKQLSTNGMNYWVASKCKLRMWTVTPRSYSTARSIAHIFLPQTVSMIYTALRRLPKDHPDTGENPRWNSTEPYFDSFYCNVRFTAASSTRKLTTFVSGIPSAHFIPSCLYTILAPSRAL